MRTPVDVPIHLDIGTVSVRREAGQRMFIELDPAFTDTREKPRWLEAVVERVQSLNAELASIPEEREEYAGWKTLQYIAYELYRTQSAVEVLLRFTPPDAGGTCNEIARLSLQGGTVQSDHNGQPFNIKIDDDLRANPPAWLQGILEKIDVINRELSGGERGEKPSEDAWRTLRLLLRFLSRSKIQLLLQESPSGNTHEP